jgi:hypothetical protein
MGLKKSIVAAVFLLAMTAPVFPVSGFLVHAPEPLAVGSAISFSARLSYLEARCQAPQHSRIVQWYVACANGSGWRSEGLHSPPGETWWLDYEETYTVTEADMHSMNLCFVIYAESGCWEAPRLEEGSRRCLSTGAPSFNIELQHSLECEILPDCPLCARFDLAGLMDAVGNPAETVQVLLLRGEEQVAVLGTAGPKQKLPAKAQVALTETQGGLKRGSKLSGYALKAVNSKGKELAFQKITIRVR